MRRMAIVFGVLALVLAGLVALRLRAQTAARNALPGGAGEIEGTEVNLSARITARLESMAVRKGQAVKAGDLLVKLDCSDQAAALGEAEARLVAARAQAAAASATVDFSRRGQEAAAASRAAARAQAEALTAQRDAAARRAQRLESLTTDVSLEARDQSRAGADSLARQVEAAEAQALASAEQARAAGNAIRASGAQATAADATVKAVEETAVRARLLAAECDVKAPRDALVDDLPHELGELVTAGQTLVRLVDISEVKALFYLPNAEVAAARPGGRALVVADAWPGETFQGTVATVSAEAEFTPRNIQTRSDRDRLVYPVEVHLSNPAGKLRPGMPVQVTLPREK